MVLLCMGNHSCMHVHTPVTMYCTLEGFPSEGEGVQAMGKGG